jgi:hypothetical protein
MPVTLGAGAVHVASNGSTRPGAGRRPWTARLGSGTGPGLGSSARRHGIARTLPPALLRAVVHRPAAIGYVEYCEALQRRTA